MLYFRDSVLQDTEEVRYRDVLEAIEKASSKPADLPVEDLVAWAQGRRGRTVIRSLGAACKSCGGE